MFGDMNYKKLIQAPLVIETWDGRNALSRWWVDDSDQWVPKAMAKTLVKLKSICES